VQKRDSTTSCLANSRARSSCLPRSQPLATCNAREPVAGEAAEIGISVLVVDDNETFLDASCALLTREGLQVLGVASTSAEAVRKVEHLRPDVVLVDVHLGAESGFDLARRLVDVDPSHGSTVILMSTQAAADLADLITESPASGFLAKSELSSDAIRRFLHGGIR
jgi:DNA-binding NarL/FixJ family response regulator